MYNINRRKFLGLFGCSCCSLILPSCSTVPITDRKQLSIIPEAKINSQAAAAYEQFRTKAKLIKSGPQLKEVKGSRSLLVLFLKIKMNKIQQGTLDGIIY